MSEAGREAAKSAAELCRAGEREREREHPGCWKEVGSPPGRLGRGSERHKERRGGGAGGAKFPEPEKGEEEVQRTRKTAQGGEEWSCAERAGSPGGARRHLPCPTPPSPPGPNALTMMEKTKATMLMGYAGQKHETMASHR